MTKSDPDWDPTKFGFILKQFDGAVRLSHYHKGWRSQNQHYRRSNYSWALLLNALKKYVEVGEVMEFGKRG